MTHKGMAEAAAPQRRVSPERAPAAMSAADFPMDKTAAGTDRESDCMDSDVSMEGSQS